LNCLLDSWVVVAIRELDSFILQVQEVLVGYDVRGLRSISAQQGWVFWPFKRQLVVSKCPDIVVVCNALLGQLAPGAFADDSIQLWELVMSDGLALTFWF